MKTNNNTKQHKNSMNKKTGMFFLTMLLLTTPTLALFGLFEKPVTTVDMVTLHSIWKDANGQAYGWNQTNSTCAPIHFQVPYKQTHDRTFVKLGYVPLCDINQSDYPDHYLTVFCNNEITATYNYTDNCFDTGGGGVYEYEWLDLDFENVTAGQFQTLTLTTVFSCMVCVNDTVLSPNRTDFWIRVENTGNRMEVTNQTIEVFPQLEIVTDAINSLIGFVDAIIDFGTDLFIKLGFIWSIFAMFLFMIFMFLRVRKSLKDALGRK